MSGDNGDNLGKRLDGEDTMEQELPVKPGHDPVAVMPGPEFNFDAADLETMVLIY